MPLTAAETATARRLIDLALAEDLDAAGDVTSLATIPGDSAGRAVIIARAAGIVAGLPVAALVFETVDPKTTFTSAIADGTAVQSGTELANVVGPKRSILTAERTALNFLQRLSGVATLTRRYLDAAGGKTQVLDTRKTTPGWRLLEKYAVRMGGGHNHRVGLYDGVLIKDNHLAPFGSGPEAITKAVQAARAKVGHTVPLEIEVDTFDQLDAALAVRPDIVLLDNMTNDQMREAVRRRNAIAPKVLLEASGGINLDTVRTIAETGVDRISVGALTHSAPALDIALDYEPS